jgi:hypothetical protein
MVNTWVSAIPMWMTAMVFYDMDPIPRTIFIPVIFVRPYPVHIDQGGSWPIAWTPVEVMVTIPIGRPSVPIVVVPMLDYPNSRRFPL